ATVNKDESAERGARIARRDDRGPQRAFSSALGWGDRACREHVREEQRREPGCPAREGVLDQRGQATSRDRLRILDLGAGNAWLSNRLSCEGHDVCAVDMI